MRLHVLAARRTALAAALVALVLAAVGLAGGVFHHAGKAAPAVHLRSVLADAANGGRARDGVDGGRGGDGDEGGSSFGSANICGQCSPPLTFHNGFVMGTQPTPSGPVTQPGVISITPIYWSPGGESDYPAGYVSTVNRYIHDLAADSGKTTNPMSVLTEYTYPVNGVDTPLKYQISAGPVLDDTDPYPVVGRQCTKPAAPTHVTACIPDTVIQPEISSFLATVKAANPGLSSYLTPSLGNMYLMMFPPDIETAEGGSNSEDYYCTIHGKFIDASKRDVIYGDEPYLPEFCGTGQVPDLTSADLATTTPGIVFGDSQANIIEHEVMEAITNPGINAIGGYFDGKGQEIGDECGGFYGKLLGSTDPSNASQTAYNVVINGDKYYLQESLSNKSFASSTDGRGCIKGAFGSPTGTAKSQTTRDDAATPDIGSVTVNSSQTNLPADGSTTATVTVTITDTAGSPVAGDHVTLKTTDANQGDADAPGTTVIDDGQCGTIDTPDDGFTTNDSGQVFATYTTSTANASCSIDASELIGGTSNDAIVFQGDSDQGAPSLTQSVPTSITAGGSAMTFTTTSTNPGNQSIFNTTQTLYLLGDNNGSSGLHASDVTLSYADGGTNNQFVAMTPTGTTADGGYIEADLDPGSVVDYDPGATNPITFKLSLDKDAVDSAATGSPLILDAEFDQLNLSDGASTNLSYDVDQAFVVPAKSTGPAPIVVTTPPSTITTVVQPTLTYVITTPGPAAKAVGCTVPRILRKSEKSARAALKKAKCLSTTLIIPTHRKSRKLIVLKTSPAGGRKVAAGVPVTVTFKIVKLRRK